MKSHWVLLASALVAFTFLFSGRESAPSQAVDVDEARQRYLTALQIVEIEERRLTMFRKDANEVHEIYKPTILAGKMDKQSEEHLARVNQEADEQLKRLQRAQDDLKIVNRNFNDALDIKTD